MMMNADAEPLQFMMMIVLFYKFVNYDDDVDEKKVVLDIGQWPWVHMSLNQKHQSSSFQYFHISIT